MGAPSTAKEQQSERVKVLNYQLMSEMKEYEAEFDQMLSIFLSGSTFKKVYYDELLGPLSQSLYRRMIYLFRIRYMFRRRRCDYS